LEYASLSRLSLAKYVIDLFGESFLITVLLLVLPNIARRSAIFTPPDVLMLKYSSDTILFPSFFTVTCSVNYLLLLATGLASSQIEISLFDKSPRLNARYLSVGFLSSIGGVLEPEKVKMLTIDSSCRSCFCLPAQDGLVNEFIPECNCGFVGLCPLFIGY